MPLSAARFNFTLDKDLKEAASDEKVKSELGSKISRERIGHEVGCNSTQNPCSSIFFVCMFADGSHDVRENPY